MQILSYPLVFVCRFLVARTDCSSISLLLPIFTKYILQSYIVFKLLTGICGQLIWYFCCWIIQFYVSAFENYYHIIHFNRNNLTFCYILVSNFSFFLGYMHLLIWQLDGHSAQYLLSKIMTHNDTSGIEFEQNGSKRKVQHCYVHRSVRKFTVSMLLQQT